MMTCMFCRVALEFSPRLYFLYLLGGYMPSLMPQKIFHIKWQMKAKRHSKKTFLEEKSVSLPQGDSNLLCLAWNSNAVTITPREQLLITGSK